MTIDFADASGNVADPTSGVLSRDNTVWGSYIRSHLRAGNVIKLQQPGLERCVVILGPNAKADATLAKGCDQVQLPQQALQDATAGAIQVLSPEVAVYEYDGNPWRGSYTARDDVKASRYSPSGTGTFVATPLTRVQPSVWTWEYYNVTAKNQVIKGAKPTGNQYWFIYPKNELVLGTPLGEGQWVKLTYHEVAIETIQADGPCVVPAQSFDGRMDNNPTFDGDGVPDTIASWFERNMKTIGANVAVSGTDADKNVEFYYQDNAQRLDLRGKRRGVMDSRLRAETAQFTAAGSYGLLHATIKDWLWGAAKNAVLDAAFNLGPAKPGSPQRCLPELAADEQASLRLGTASHSYAKRTMPKADKDPCMGGVACTQQEWARYWSKVIRYYNFTQKTYVPRTDGLNDSVRRGLEQYDAR